MLLEGPRSRTAELMRLFRISRELFRGFRALHFVGPCVSVFGSARLNRTDPMYKVGVETTEKLSRAGFAIICRVSPLLAFCALRIRCAPFFIVAHFIIGSGGLKGLRYHPQHGG